VLTLHGSDVNRLPEINLVTRRCFTTAVREATFVSAVSKALAERTQHLTGRMPTVMPIGIDLRRYRELPDKAAARAALGLPEGARIVLFVGSLLEAKGVRLLARALDTLKGEDVLGVFVGGGPLLGAISSGGRRRCVGSVPNEQVTLYMRAADVLVLPSVAEGMPTVLVEAGAAGLPVIATSVGGIPELLKGDRGLLIAPDSLVGLVEALETVLAHPTTAAARARRLKDYVTVAYDVDESARAMMRVYESLRSRAGAATQIQHGIVSENENMSSTVGAAFRAVSDRFDEPMR
jgi:teichuronic acid biosynthesis glycosyltransferase TuaC